MAQPIMSKKKPAFPIGKRLVTYLTNYSRYTKLPILYQDLLRFVGSIVVYNQNQEDTLWIRVYFADHERDEIDYGLKKIYAILHSDGTESIIPHLSIDAIDYCTFGNSKPFRIKVRNVINDNFTYFYVKKADASRVYGLELEHMLSPYNLHFLVYQDTMIEEHISGIPGDVFIDTMLDGLKPHEKSQIAKEFVKFNERCMIRLLGDMRSYNYVVIPIHDFDHVEYKIRAIDFDQQSYEGRLIIYRPQFFKENNPMVSLVKDRLPASSVEQYKIEERSITAKRILSREARLEQLLSVYRKDRVSTDENVTQLSKEIYDLAMDKAFKQAKSMGEVLTFALDFVKRNYQNPMVYPQVNTRKRD